MNEMKRAGLVIWNLLDQHNDGDENDTILFVNVSRRSADREAMAFLVDIAFAEWVEGREGTRYGVIRKIEPKEHPGDEMTRRSRGTTFLKGQCESCPGLGEMQIKSVNNICISISLMCSNCSAYVLIYEPKVKK